jgi:hypothetical protein
MVKQRKKKSIDSLKVHERSKLSFNEVKGYFVSKIDESTLCYKIIGIRYKYFNKKGKS